MLFLTKHDFFWCMAKFNSKSEDLILTSTTIPFIGLFFHFVGCSSSLGLQLLDNLNLKFGGKILFFWMICVASDEHPITLMMQD